MHGEHFRTGRGREPQVEAVDHVVAPVHDASGGPAQCRRRAEQQSRRDPPVARQRRPQGAHVDPVHRPVPRPGHREPGPPAPARRPAGPSAARRPGWPAPGGVVPRFGVGDRGRPNLRSPSDVVRHHGIAVGPVPGTGRLVRWRPTRRGGGVPPILVATRSDGHSAARGRPPGRRRSSRLAELTVGRRTDPGGRGRVYLAIWPGTGLVDRLVLDVVHVSQDARVRRGHPASLSGGGGRRGVLAGRCHRPPGPGPGRWPAWSGRRWRS